MSYFRIEVQNNDWKNFLKKHPDKGEVKFKIKIISFKAEKEYLAYFLYSDEKNFQRFKTELRKFCVDEVRFFIYYESLTTETDKGQASLHGFKSVKIMFSHSDEIVIFKDSVCVLPGGTVIESPKLCECKHGSCLKIGWHEEYFDGYRESLLKVMAIMCQTE